MGKENTDNVLVRALRGLKRSPSASDTGMMGQLEKLMYVKRKGKAPTVERIGPSSILMQRAEMLYRMEPLIFSGVNKLTRRISSGRIYFTGDDEVENKAALDFAFKIKLPSSLNMITKDALIYGFGAFEIVKAKGFIDSLEIIDPKTFDWQREGSEMKLDESGTPVGFRTSKLGRLEGEKYTPEEIFLVRYYTIGEYCLGISPLEAAFKTAWIKLNLEEALGEAIYRHGYPIYSFQVGTEKSPYQDITPEKIKQAKKIIGNMDTATEIVLPYWIKLEMLKGGDTGNFATLLEYFGMEILAALEMPKSFSTSSSPGQRNSEEMDFEKTIMALQGELIRQTMDQVLEPYYASKHFKTKPLLNYEIYAPELQNSKLRRLSAYAKNGLITRTLDVENSLRKAEGFKTREEPSFGKEGRSTKCIFELGECPIRTEEALTLEKLGSFCNICIKRLEAERKTLKPSVSLPPSQPEPTQPVEIEPEIVQPDTVQKEVKARVKKQ